MPITEDYLQAKIKTAIEEGEYCEHVGATVSKELFDFDVELYGLALQGMRVNEALDIARRFGGIDGDHHKAWVIDQMVRKLTGDNYAAFVADAKNGEDGPDTYEWDEGIAP